MKNRYAVENNIIVGMDNSYSSAVFYETEYGNKSKEGKKEMKEQRGY